MVKTTVKKAKKPVRRKRTGKRAKKPTGKRRKAIIPG
jgi:hypothetical protein